MIRKIVPFIPLAVMAGTLLYTCFAMAATDYVFQTEHIVAMMLVFANIVFYLAKFSPRIGRRITLAIILLGLINVLAFTPAVYWVSFGIGPVRIPLQPYSLLLLIIFFFCNLSYLQKYRK